MNPIRRGLRRLGWDLVPARKAKALPAQLDRALRAAGIDLILDVGANTGQYAVARRAWGYDGRILSFEPLASAHAVLARRAAADPAWEVAERMAIGAQPGEVEIQVSAESDMSSILPQTDVLREVSPSSRVTGRERVRLARLDEVVPAHLRDTERVFLKVDTQGYEGPVLDGAEGIMPRILGIQLELPLVPCYQGEVGLVAMIERMAGLGFAPHLVFPGYFERRLARQLQVDVVFMREPRAGA